VHRKLKLAYDDLSDLSDEDEYLYPDKKGVELKLIKPKLNPTTNPRIKQLFSNTDKVLTCYLVSCYKFI